MKPVKLHGKGSISILLYCILLVFLTGCAVRPDSSLRHHTSHIADGTKSVVVNTSMEEIIEWFGDHDYTIHEIKGGYRTEPVRLGVSMWALYNFEQVEDQVRIGAYWSKGPSVFSPNYKKNRENESYTPELSTFEQAIFRDRGSKSSHVIENLVAIMEDAGSGLVLHTLLTQDGDRQYAEIVYSADTTLTPEEEEAIEKLEKEREAQENYVAQRGTDMSYNLNFLPAKDHFPDLLRSINEVDHLQMVHQKMPDLDKNF